MSEEFTADEVEQQYLQAMGDNLGQLFYSLYNEHVWLYWKWGNYVVLFGSNPERVVLLNAAAPTFFKLVQDSLWEDVLLHICRLTDPHEINGKRNLSLQVLTAAVAPAMKAEVKRLVGEAGLASEFARDWRNRHIAHRDLQLEIGKSARPLAPASRASVKSALEAISAVLNYIDHAYRDTTTRFDAIDTFGGAEVLLHVLRDGLEAETARRNRLKSGQYLPEDFGPWRPI